MRNTNILMVRRETLERKNQQQGCHDPAKYDPARYDPVALGALHGPL